MSWGLIIELFQEKYNKITQFHISFHISICLAGIFYSHLINMGMES